jgi:hypothetical protein
MQRGQSAGALVFSTRAWLSSSAICSLAVLGLTAGPEAVLANQRVDRRQQAKLDDALRREGQALVEVAEAAENGRVLSDFSMDWRNDFLKAQPGTFVPFTIAIDTPMRSPFGALMYVRVVVREDAAGKKRRDAVYETIFPVEANQVAALPVRIRRGFAVPPGRYKVFVVLRERPPDPLSRPPGRPRTSVMIRELDVPDFWVDRLVTSTVMLADRVEQLQDAVPAARLDENPYVVGTSRIHPAVGTTFRRGGELIVVFLIYNPSVGSDRHFDVQVDYHLYRKDPEGERYVTRTAPQRFTPAMMGAHFNPASGDPVMAGQGIPLATFELGEYRLGITVTDLLSRQSIARDVTFTVIGS